MLGGFSMVLLASTFVDDCGDDSEIELLLAQGLAALPMDLHSSSLSEAESSELALLLEGAGEWLSVVAA
jgi:hypothetical protein